MQLLLASTQTPEFFYMPEFLVNKDNFVFGTRQNDEEVCCDVQLPPWASTAQEFVRIHRAALGTRCNRTQECALLTVLSPIQNRTT